MHALTRMRNFPSTVNLLSVYVMKGCWMLTNASSVVIIVWVLSFALLIMVYYKSCLVIVFDPFDVILNLVC